MKQPLTCATAATLALAACSDSPLTSDTDLSAGNPHAVLSAADGEVVMHSLNNPRGLAFGPNGALYVAEAGRGGIGPCFQSGMTVCYGPTGAVGRLYQGKQDTVASGLPSYANAAGRAEGPNGITLLGNGGAYVSIGLEFDPRIRTSAPEFAGFASLVHISPTALLPAHAQTKSTTAWEFVADLGTYEIDVNPDCGRIDSNPFGVLAHAGSVLIVDAGANAVVRRNAQGDLSTFAAFPSRYTEPLRPACPPVPADYPETLPAETVPTSVAVGPDGAYYVGQLTGFPLVQGAASVYRIVPGSRPEVYLTGFTFIVSITFDSGGNLYVLQHVNAPGGMAVGALIRVAPDGSRSTVIGGLSRATSVAIGPDGAAYISHLGSSVGTGHVLRFPL